MQHRSRTVFGVLAAAAVLTATLLATAEQTSLSGGPGPHYRIHNGDLLELNFVFVPEFNQVVTVRPDGYITLRAVGETLAAGTTVQELQASIETKYAGILKDPVVSLVIREFERPFFLAHGEVQKPGKYELRNSTKLSEAVAIAGGLSESAKHSQVLLFRRASAGEVEVRQIDLKKLLQGRGLDGDVEIRPGDTVFVPKNRISKIKPFVPMPYFRMLIPGV